MTAGTYREQRAPLSCQMWQFSCVLVFIGQGYLQRNSLTEVKIEELLLLTSSERKAESDENGQSRYFLKAAATPPPLETSSLTLLSAATSFGINEMTSSRMLRGMATTPSCGSQKMISPYKLG